MRRFVLLLVALLVLPLLSQAEEDYFLPDSDTRLLTEEELWLWDYESLRFLLNEIYARHGYHFIEGSDYAGYFEAKPWYAPHPKGNIDGCLAELNDVELANADLIQLVMIDMTSQNTMNTDNGASLWSNTPVIRPLAFMLTAFDGGQRLPVYSAPGKGSWRGAKGKAVVSTNGEVWCAGTQDGWLLIYYETSKGSIRVGYVDASNAKGEPDNLPSLSLAAVPAVLTAKTTLTDDPARNNSTITTLKKGAKVTYLAPYHGDREWAYVETKVSGKRVRGFVPMEALKLEE